VATIVGRDHDGDGIGRHELGSPFRLDGKAAYREVVERRSKHDERMSRRPRRLERKYAASSVLHELTSCLRGRPDFIVVDEGSTDDTAMTVNDLGGRRVRLVRDDAPREGGVAHNHWHRASPRDVEIDRRHRVIAGRPPPRPRS